VFSALVLWCLFNSSHQQHPKVPTLNILSITHTLTCECHAFQNGRVRWQCTRTVSGSGSARWKCSVHVADIKAEGSRIRWTRPVAIPSSPVASGSRGTETCGENLQNSARAAASDTHKMFESASGTLSAVT